MLTLKDHVSGNAEFQYCRNGNLVYKASTGLEFIIPVADTDGISVPRTEKGIFFMRWIRKHLDSIEKYPTNPCLDIPVVLSPYRDNKFTP